jgi:hypothetical protein
MIKAAEHSVLCRIVEGRDGGIRRQIPPVELTRCFEDVDPQLKRFVVPVDISDEIVAEFHLVSFTQDLSVEFL